VKQEVQMANSIHRIGLAIAGVIAILTVAGVFIVDGYNAARTSAALAAASRQAATYASTRTATATATPTPTASATPTPTLEPEIVYVNPAPTPAVIRVVRQAPPVVPVAPPAAPPTTQSVPTSNPTPVPTGSPTRTPYQDDGGGSDN
jgi:hypothetical protein